MALDGFKLDGLSAYKDEINGPLFSSLFLATPTINTFRKQMGVAGTQSIQNLDVNHIYSSDFCTPGNGYSSGVTFTQRDITVARVKADSYLCVDTLRTYWVGQLMNDPTSNEDLPLREVITGALKGQFQEDLETALWQGNIGTGTGMSGLIDGIYENLRGTGFLSMDGASSAATAHTSSVSYSNIDSTVDAMVAVLPSKLKKPSAKMILCLGTTNYETLKRKMIAANYFAPDFFVKETANQDVNSFVHPVYSYITVKQFPGLDNTNYMFLMPADFVVIGLGAGNVGDIRMEYVFDKDAIKYLIKSLVGISVARPEYCVTNFLY